MNTAFAAQDATARRIAPVTAAHAATLPTAPAAIGPRFDMYGTIHKALRLFMADTLKRLGAVDTGHASELAPVLDQTESLLGLMASHVKHENGFVHAAIEARRPGGSATIADDHEEHLATIDQLRDEVAGLRAAAADERSILAQRLYRHLALFVADNLQHMAVEETSHNALLWALYRDDELVAIHDRLVASIEPGEMMLALTWIARAVSPQELIGMLADMQAKAPQEVMRAVLARVRDAVDDRRWVRVARALKLPTVPGLMTA